MILKPTYLLFCSLIVTISAKCQFTQTWNTSNNSFSASAGLDFKNEGSLTMNGWQFNDRMGAAFFGNYSSFLNKYKIGYGINIINNRYSGNNNYKGNEGAIKLNINKQFELKKGTVISSGIGLGGAFVDYNAWKPSDNFEYVVFHPEISILLKSKKLKVGIGISYMFGEIPYWRNPIRPSFFATYTFGKSEGFQFTPQISAADIGSSLGGMFSFKSKFILGGGASAYQGLRAYTTVGYTVKDKFKINYSYKFKRGYDHFFPKHELTLGFQLGKK